MSETEKPQPGSGEEQSGAEAPTQPERPAGEAAQAQQVPPAPPVPPVRREPRRVRAWVAAAIGAGLLLGGGLGGYLIGAASDRDDRPGFGRLGDPRPGDFRDGPFRGER